MGNNPILFSFCNVPHREFLCFHLSLKYHGNTCLLLKIAELTGVHTQIISQPWDYKDHKYLWNKSCFLNNKEMGIVLFVWTYLSSFDLIWTHRNFRHSKIQIFRKFSRLIYNFMTSLFMTSFRIYNLNSPQFQDFPINWDRFLEKPSYKSKTL